MDIDKILLIANSAYWTGSSTIPLLILDPFTVWKKKGTQVLSMFTWIWTLCTKKAGMRVRGCKISTNMSHWWASVRKTWKAFIKRHKTVWRRTISADWAVPLCAASFLIIIINYWWLYSAYPNCPICVTTPNQHYGNTKKFGSHFSSSWHLNSAASLQTVWMTQQMWEASSEGRRRMGVWWMTLLSGAKRNHLQLYSIGEIWETNTPPPKKNLPQNLTEGTVPGWADAHGNAHLFPQACTKQLPTCPITLWVQH